MELTQTELNQVTGGAIKLSLAVAVAGLITLIVGIIDGYVRPLKCNS